MKKILLSGLVISCSLIASETKFNISDLDVHTKKYVTQITPRIERFSSVTERLNSFCKSIVGLYKNKTYNKYDVQFVLDAVMFAALKHKDTTRKDADRTPGVIHPIEVANNLIRVGKITDAYLVSACLLHDTLEDSDTTSDELARHFGNRILKIVEFLTDDKTTPKSERKKKTVQKMSIASEDTTIVMFADKLSNLGNLEDIPPAKWLKNDPDRVTRYFNWVDQIVSNSNIIEKNSVLKSAIYTKIKAYRLGKSKAAKAVAMAKNNNN